MEFEDTPAASEHQEEEVDFPIKHNDEAQSTLVVLSSTELCLGPIRPQLPMAMPMRLLQLLLCAGLLASCAEGEGHTGLPFGRAVREKYFQFEPGFRNFNHGGFGATPIPVRRAQEALITTAEAQPTRWFAGGNGSYHAALATVRPRLASLMGANESDLVFLDDASSGLNAVLRSLRWQPNDILLLTTAAYAVLPNTAQWLQRRYGIRTLHVEVHFPATGGETFLDPVREALEKLGGEASRLRLAVFDHVSSYPPAVLPVEALAKQVKEAAPSALVLLDGAHALGQVPISMTALATAGVDFYVTDGHKWLMAPKGSGALWARPSAQPLLEPAIISSDNAPGSSFQSRFDYIGTRDYTPWCAMGSTMDFRRDVLGGEDRIQSYVTGLARWAGRHMADRLGTETVAPDSMTPGMFALRLPLPEDWTPSQKTACSGLIAQGLIGQYSMQVISFALHTPTSDGREEVTHWIRVSAQVYLERSDFEDLTHAVMSLRDMDAAESTPIDAGAGKPERSMQKPPIIWLHVYDLGQMTAKLNTFMLRSMGIGAYHVGVEVLGDEWYFRWSDTAGRRNPWSICADSKFE
ncbi:egt-2 [Symbiodinium sp. CCMP2456]|nr:egt-2 [Symbiodinium sp. CCMP2456]